MNEWPADRKRALWRGLNWLNPARWLEGLVRLYSRRFGLGIFTFIGNWNNFFWPLLVTESMSMRVLSVGMALLKGGNFGKQLVKLV